MSDIKFCIYRDKCFLALESFDPLSAGFKLVASIADPKVVMGETKDSTDLLKLQAKYGGEILSLRETEEKQKSDLFNRK